ncbi:MAG: ethanolamine ammonia-lyase subunit EutB [Pirellulales bacterium]|nr:ethanolamine ammonia-lyase subunit EutB [Pirellulales bacterium]
MSAIGNLRRLNRRQFCGLAAGGVLGARLVPGALAGLHGGEVSAGVRVSQVGEGEDLFAYVRRVQGRFDPTLYRQIIGAANEFKEGDQILGLAAADGQSRHRARILLGNTRVGELAAHPLFHDALYDRLQADLDPASQRKLADLTLGELRALVLTRDEAEIRSVLDGLPSDVIGCLVKLMTEEDLIAAGRRIFHPLPGTQIGAAGYLGARIQPNSPTDNVDDIVWQVFSGWSYAVGDVVLGTNPVSSEPDSVAAVEAALLDLRRTFGIEDVLPHSVLAHVDIQADLEARRPGTTGIWFQSLAGSTAANATFDVTLEKMLEYAARRTGKYGFYFETGQGADFTNGHGQGTDMVVHEARKYGLARLLKRKVAEAQRHAGLEPAPWVHLNDVAGFIGPEVFRTREQLVRCCLEDIAMGKLHGLTIGLDVCSTLHMDVSLDDLDWCLDRILPANPAYLMALPTKNDPMLGYLTTGFQDHVRLRRRFGYRVNDRMWAFFQRLGVIDREGNPTAQFGRPLWVWLQYRKAKGDTRPPEQIEAEGRKKIEEVRGRGVFLAEGHGRNPWDLTPQLDREIRDLYADSKQCIYAELTSEFVRSLPASILLRSTSKDRNDYILHPQTGEVLDEPSRRAVGRLRAKHAGEYQIQIVVSDGLNAHAIMDDGHLSPYLSALREELQRKNYAVAPELLVLHGGRVRAGYRIGELLFGENSDGSARRGIIHVIGERPGSMHRTFSAYITAPPAVTWSVAGRTDHNITRVVSGVADTALGPATAALASAKIIEEFWAKGRSV